MRYRVLFRVALAAGTLAACGGSSSETPPPMQPDPVGFRYASVPPARIAEVSDAGAAPRTSPEITDDDLPKPRVPARSTWGSGPAR
jgi:hypothetical protein